MPPGAETLSVRVFNFLYYGHNAQVNALCLLLLMLALAPLIVFVAISRGKGWLVGRRIQFNGQPTHDPSQEGNQAADARSQVPSWEGPGAGTFVGRRSQQTVLVAALAACQVKSRRGCGWQAFGMCALACALGGCSPSTPSNQA